jgi:crotonobetainyl-CoA:carnitine CoA-transferase CaiB-like acyl-CoA transferase
MGENAMGPLKGVKVIELAGIGPGPMCAMLLADLGATVLRIDRPGAEDLNLNRPLKYNLLLRSRETLSVDLKDPAGLALVMRLIEKADVLTEGFRPGVTERLGLGPEDCFKRNRKLVYGRMTGWGQDGPLAQAAGHDLNYIALTGALHAIGPRDGAPVPPLNLIADFGGGALYLALGIVAALLEARQSGQGQVVDATMLDGVASLMTAFSGMLAAGITNTQRGANVLDGGAYFYQVYECADGEHVSLAPIEGKFHAELLRRLGLDAAAFDQSDRAGWPAARERLAAIFRTRTRAEWCALLEGTDVCFAPVLSLPEAAAHPHNVARGTFVAVDGVLQSGPAPRFSRTVPDKPTAPRPPDAQAALAGWLDAEEIAALRAQ